MSASVSADLLQKLKEAFGGFDPEVLRDTICRINDFLDRPVAMQGTQRSRRCGQLARALAAAQGAMRNPEKAKEAEVQGTTRDGKPFSYTYNYADLADVIESARGPLAANEVAIIQALSYDGQRACCVTELLHSSGEWLRNQMTFPLETKDIQKLGGLWTYMRRYSQAAILNLAPEHDDDGQLRKSKGKVRNPIREDLKQLGGERQAEAEQRRPVTKDELSAFFKVFWPLAEAKFANRKEAEKWLQDQEPNLHQCFPGRLRELFRLAQGRRSETEDPEMRQKVQRGWAMLCDKKGLGVDERHWWAQKHFDWVVDPEKGRASAKSTPINQIRDACFALQKAKPETIEAIKQEYQLWLDDQREQKGAP